MPKIGDTRVIKGRGHRLMIWCGSEWKGIALENKKLKNSIYDMETNTPRYINKKAKLEKPIGITETFTEGGPLATPVSLNANIPVSLLDSNVNLNHYLLDSGTEGQIKTIIHNNKLDGGTDLIVIIRMAPGPGFATVTSDGSNETSRWLFIGNFWYLISGSRFFIIT